MSDNAKTAARTGVRRAWIGVGVPIVSLVAVVTTLAILALASFARDLDSAFAEASAKLASSSLQGRARAIGSVGLDLANWDDAFDHISKRWDPDWVQNNIYSSVADGMIVFRADGAVRFSWFGDEFAGQAGLAGEAAVRAATRLDALRRLARAPTPSDTIAHTYARVGETLLVVAIVPITQEDDAARIAHNPLRGYDYLAVIEFQDPASLSSVGESLSLEDLRFSPLELQSTADSIALPIEATDGERVGTLLWRHTRPGVGAFQHRIWKVVLCLLLIGALTLLIARQLVVRHVGAMAHGEAALETSRLKAEFLAKVGHELRTPLNGIIGYAEIIQEETDSPVAREDADRIIAAARHLNHLLNDILDQSRLDAGRMTMKSEVLPVAGLLAEVQGLMRPSARAAAVELTFQPSAIANYVVADHARLRQCLLNLVGNAIKFSPRGNVMVKTRMEQRSDGDMVVFDIVDDGAGIAKHDLPNLFKPFSQGTGAVGGARSGAGLGLSISRDLARAMGGDVTVVSELGKGSTFSLAAPVASAKALRAA